MRSIVMALFLVLFASGAAAQSPLTELTSAGLIQRQLNDRQALMIYRQGLVAALEFARGQGNLFPPERLKRQRLLSADERQEARLFWQRLLDYYLALDSLGRYHSDFLELEDKAARQRSFLIAYGAFLAQYRFALDFISATERNNALGVLFNEAVPELGLPRGAYDRFKFRFLNVIRATEFGTLAVIYEAIGNDQAGDLQGLIEQDAAEVWKARRGKGPVLTLKNGLDLVRKAGFTAWFPVQSGVAEWMGDAKVWRVKRSLITPEQIQDLAPKLEPGDILLERREWYLSNIGLPGFWPHAALYIGTADDRRAYFDDPDVQEWVRAQGRADGSFEGLLADRFPEAYALSRRPQEQDHIPRVIEAISEGVSFTTLEHSAEADSLAVLRPRLTKVEKALALMRAFRYSGRPYDFNFDFATDATLVCTELVYKSYEPSIGMRGLHFPLVRIMGRLATPANELVQQFDAQYGTDQQQTDLILFLDGNERSGRAVDAGLDEFRRSWRRPKWHILTQEEPKAARLGGPASTP